MDVIKGNYYIIRTFYLTFTKLQMLNEINIVFSRLYADF